MATRKPTNNAVVSVADIYNGMDGDEPSMNNAPDMMGEDMMSDDLALQKTLGMLGDEGEGAVVRIYAVDDKLKNSFLYETSVAEFHIGGLSDIQERYGKGEYHIRVFAGGRVLTHRRVSIGEPFKKKTEVVVASATPNIAEIMAQQTQMFLNGMREISSQIAASKSQGMGAQETIALITALNPLMGGGRSQQHQPDALELLTKVIALQRDLTPPNVNDDNAGTMLAMKGLETFGPLLTGMMEKGKQNAVLSSPSPTPALPPPVSTDAPVLSNNPVSQPVNQEDDMSIKFRMLAGALMLAAANNAENDLYVDMALNNFDDDELNQLLNVPDWFERLCQKIPDAGNCRPWFEKLRADILKALQEPQNADSVPENSPSGTPNASGAG